MSAGVVITGIGVVSPFGVGRAALASALRAGRTAFAPIDRFETVDRRSHTAALVRDFRASDHIPPNRLRRMDPLSAQALAAAQLALGDAGVERTAESEPDPRAGVVFGTAYGCQTTTLRYADKLVERGAYFTNPIDFPDSIDGAGAAHIAMALGLQGPSTTVVDGALSGETALWHAVHAIAAGRAARVLVGAGDELTDASHAALDGLGLLCRPDEQGEELMCPCDARRRGPVPGEGTCVLLLEAAQQAAQRGARVYAEILGIGHGSEVNTPPFRFAPDTTAAVSSMRGALAQAGVATDQVDLFSGGAASLPEMDGLELAAANEVLTDAAGCFLTAVQGLSGELPAAGVFRVAAACLAMSEGFVPPVPGLESPEPATRLRGGGVAEEARLRYVLHHTMARGGQSVSLVLGNV